MRRSNIKIVTLLGVTLSFAGGLPMLTASDDIQDPNPPELAPGPLDGMVFRGALGLDGKPRDIADVLVFENGNFLSRECELRCKYPARPYYVRVIGGKTQFISESKCPYKDARIIWRGTVEGDRIKGTSTWTVKRWYWTVEDSFEFEGRLVDEQQTSAITE